MYHVAACPARLCAPPEGHVILTRRVIGFDDWQRSLRSIVMWKRSTPTVPAEAGVRAGGQIERGDETSASPRNKGSENTRGGGEGILGAGDNDQRECGPEMPLRRAGCGGRRAYLRSARFHKGTCCVDATRGFCSPFRSAGGHSRRWRPVCDSIMAELGKDWPRGGKQGFGTGVFGWGTLSRCS